MARTLKRQPYSVSTKSSDYTQPQSFIHTEFKGLSNIKNDVLADQLTFTSAENVYVDDNMLLVSRPPFKFYDGEGYIERQWQFGPYRLRLYKKRVATQFVYTLRCISHNISVPEGSIDKFVEKEWTIPTNNPEITCTQIEDKIFIWFGGFDLVVFNTAKLYFEPGIKYLYLPILSLVVSGIETSLESENFLTSSGRKRYQYSTLSSVNFESLLDKEVRVNLNGKYLYNTTITRNSKKVLAYPYSDVGNNCIDMAVGVETPVFLRTQTSNIFEVSFDGKYFQRLPSLPRVIGLPQLTKDATHVVAFTSTGIAWCKLFADESDEQAYTFEFAWDIKPYAEKRVIDGENSSYTSINSNDFKPSGHFKSRTQFAYVFLPSFEETAILYAEWSIGTNSVWSSKTLLSNNAETLVPEDDIKIAEEYVAPHTVYGTSVEAALLVSILNAKDLSDKSTVIIVTFRENSTEIEHHLLDGYGRSLTIPASQSDIHIVGPDSHSGYSIEIATNISFVVVDEEIKDLFVYYQWYKNSIISTGSVTRDGTSKHFKMPADARYTDGVLTDTYYYVRGNAIDISNIVQSEFVPLYVDENGIWLNADGTIWTSALTADNVLELDEFINFDENGQVRTRLTVPTHCKTLREHYFSFEADGKHLLEVTQTKRDVDKMFSEDATDFLLYLPKRNEQVLPNKITNLHPIADNILSVFTEASIWNITASTLDDGSVVYSAPMISKVPAGCRDGDDVMTALDGQALLLATSRGIAALAPQDFVATADNVMTYLSDPIQDIYYKFYTEKVMSTVKTDGYDSHIKMLSYRYWLLFYRYMDRDILVFDTRGNTWWKWSLPYPIRQIVVDTHLHPIMQIDYSAQNSLGGVSYVWKDHTDTVFTGTPDIGFKLPNTIKSRPGYRDDVVENTLNGLGTSVYENEFVGSRIVKEYASPIIKWHFMSQKLHFGQINNYKAIKGITAVFKGDDVMHAMLSTKIFRSSYHPEQSDVMQVPIRELRTFVHRLNLLHAINFQYKLENYTEVDEETPLKLDSLTIKYEVKEGIR